MALINTALGSMLACTHSPFPLWRGSAQDNLSGGYAFAKIISNCIKYSISALLLSVSGGKNGWVVVGVNHSRPVWTEPCFGYIQLVWNRFISALQAFSRDISLIWDWGKSWSFDVVTDPALAISFIVNTGLMLSIWAMRLHWDANLHVNIVTTHSTCWALLEHNIMHFFALWWTMQIWITIVQKVSLSRSNLYRDIVYARQSDFFF